METISQESENRAVEASHVGSEGNLVEACFSSSSTEVYDQERAKQRLQELQARTKRWKKPAIRKKRRFGLEISINIAYHPDSSGRISNDDDKPESSLSASKSSAAHSTRRRKKRSFYDAVSYQNVHKNQRKSTYSSKDRSVEIGKNDPNAFSTHVVPFSKSITSDVAPAAIPVAQMSKSKSKCKSKSKAKAKVKTTHKPKPHSKLTAPKLKSRSFDQHLEDLKSFKIKHGHCEVPYTYAENQPLSNWCSNVRYSYNLSLRGLAPTIKMNPERIARLTEIGFIFKRERKTAKKAKNDSKHTHSLRQSRRK